MLDALIDKLRSTADQWGDSAKAKVFAILAIAFAAMIAGRFLLPWEYAQIAVGSLSGFAIFCASYMLWYRVLPEEWKDRLNLRGNLELPKRRTAVIGFAVAWILICWAASPFAGGPIMGGLSVAYILGVWRMATATPEEIEAFNEAVEEEEILAAEETELEQVEETLEAYRARAERLGWGKKE